MFWFRRAPFPLTSCEDDAEVGSGGCCALSRTVSQLKNPEFRKPQSFKGRARKSVQPLSYRRYVFIFLVRKQLCPLTQRETLSLVS